MPYMQYIWEPEPEPEYIMYTFPSVVHAIVWTITGGNKNLEAWGLGEWGGVLRVERIARVLASSNDAHVVELPVIEGPSDADRDNRESMNPSSLPKSHIYIRLAVALLAFPHHLHPNCSSTHPCC